MASAQTLQFAQTSAINGWFITCSFTRCQGYQIPSYLNTKRMRNKAKNNGLGAKSMMKLGHAQLMVMQAACREALQKIE
jgi:hypothetical protein